MPRKPVRASLASVEQGGVRLLHSLTNELGWPGRRRGAYELLAYGNRREHVAPFDMFPQTAHCEAVAELIRY
jgi:hypothetical protein